MSSNATNQPTSTPKTNNVVTPQSTSTVNDQSKNVTEANKPQPLNKKLLLTFQANSEQNDPANQANKSNGAAVQSTKTPKKVTLSVQAAFEQNTNSLNQANKPPIVPNVSATTSQPIGQNNAPGVVHNKPEPPPKNLVISFQTTKNQNSIATNEANKPPTSRNISLQISKSTGQGNGLVNQTTKPQAQSKNYILSFQTNNEQKDAPVTNQSNNIPPPQKVNVVTSQPTAGQNNQPATMPGQANKPTLTPGVVTSQPTANQASQTNQANQQSSNMAYKEPEVETNANTKKTSDRPPKNIELNCLCDEGGCLYNCCCCKCLIDCWNTIISFCSGICESETYQCCKCCCGEECCSCGEECCSCGEECCSCGEECCGEECCTGCCGEVDCGECCECFCEFLGRVCCGGE